MQQDLFSEYLTGLSSEFTPVLKTGFSVSDYQHLDLSIGNQLLEPAFTEPAALSEYINQQLRKTGKKIGWGGYNERRALYQRSTLFSAKAVGETRDIHLGLDIWAAAGIPVVSPLKGIVHSFQDNTAFGDYGPTLLLEHRMEEGKFYTLYGHLSRSSLENVQVGALVEKGQQIASLGDVSENGQYAPHLHFQVIRDLMGKKGDFPGVSSKKELEQFLRNCPDPNLLLKIS